MNEIKLLENEIERAYHETAAQWKAGFRAGVEAAAKAGTEAGERYSREAAYDYKRHSGRETSTYVVAAIRSLLNESGAAEKDKP